MKTLPLEELETGMVLSNDVQTPDGRVLLKRGTALSQENIESLQTRGVMTVQIETPKPLSPPMSTEEELALLEASQTYVHPLFLFADHGNPIIQELYRQTLLRTAASMHKGFTPPPKRREDADAEKMRDLFQKDQGTPEDVVLHEVQLASFPDVYFQIVTVLRSPTSSAKEIAEVVSRDPSLSAKLLKLVNSPFYGFPSRVDSLPRAVALVGGNELSTLALGISAINVFKDIPPELIDMRTFWDHSLRCAIFAKLIAGQCDKANQERHFVAGLLHDIGKLLLYKKLPYASAQALVYSRENGVPEFESENTVIGFDHARIAMLLVREWNFPTQLEESIGQHHMPADTGEIGASIVHAADILSIASAISHGKGRVLPSLEAAAWNRIDLQPDQLGELFQNSDVLMEQLSGVFIR